MSRKAQELDHRAVAALRSPGLHFVGRVPGLALQVLPTGGRCWVLRFSFRGRRRDMGLGGYPEITLSKARRLARTARSNLRLGFDPIEVRDAKIHVLYD